jgi:hypothetical protein
MIIGVTKLIDGAGSRGTLFSELNDIENGRERKGVYELWEEESVSEA